MRIVDYMGVVLFQDDSTNMAETLTAAVNADCVLSGAVLRGEDLRWVELNVGLLMGADLQNADLRGAVLNSCDLRCALLFGANMEGCEISNSNLSGAVWGYRH